MRVWVAIWTGSTRITRYVIAWLLGGEDREGSITARLVLVAVVGGAVKGLPGTTTVAYALAAAWLVAAVVLGLRAPDPLAPATSKADESPAPEGAERPAVEVSKEPAREPAREEIITALHSLLGATGGVHLTALSKTLPGGPWATKQTRAFLAREGVRVRGGVRVPGASSLEGVHRDDIPPLPSSTSGTAVGPVVAAGQSNNNDNNNAGDHGFVVVDDPHNPARAHVHFTARGL